MTATKKVYCSDCKYFNNKWRFTDKCLEEHTILLDDWYSEIWKTNAPSIKNRYNDCKWFKEKK